MKDMLDGMPMLAKFAAVVGIPGVIALYLVWVLTAGVASAAQINAVNIKLDTHMTRMETMGGDRDKQMEELIRLARLQCINGAKTETMRVECSR